MDKKRNIIIVIGPECELEATTLRSALEFFGFNITLRMISRPVHFIELFTIDKTVDHAGILIFCFHGKKGKFRFQKLAKHRYEKGELKSDIGIFHLRKFLRLNRQIVISTGCDMGYKKMAEAFLKANASCYIGSKSGIDEDATFMFTTRLLYHLGRDLTLKKAFLKAKKMDRQTSTFELYC